MTPLLQRLGGVAPRRIAVLRALQLGDLLCAVPALRALRAAFPEAQVTLIGLPWARAFVDRFPEYLNEFAEFPGHPALPERPAASPEALAAFFADMQERRFDLAIQLHGNGAVTNGIAARLGALVTAGHCPPGGPCPEPELFRPRREDESEVGANLRLLEFLGIPGRGTHSEFPLCDADFGALAEIPEMREAAPGGYVCLHPGARAAERRRPAEQFAAVADALSRKGFAVLLTGTKDESDLTTAVARAASCRCRNLAGRTSLGSLAALLAGARLLVCNDTGISHLAAALRVRSIVLFTVSDPARWAPADRRRHRVVRAGSDTDLSVVLAHADELLGPADLAAS